MVMVYLDNNATTQPAREVVEAMVPILTESFGNPSSGHAIGQRASFHVQEARRKVASCLGADPSEIIFTSGGTESDNLAIRGLLSSDPQKRHIVTTVVEHEGVFRLVEQLEREGFEATYLKVDSKGRLNIDQFRASLRDDTAIVSIMLANNETGVLFPIDQISAICREKSIVLHTDAVQAIGKIAVDLRAMPVDMLSLSGHKFHGPKGIGALYVRGALHISAHIIGGMQERDLRGGTENVPGIVGLGAAAALVENEGEGVVSRLCSLRDRLERHICDKFSIAEVVGGSSPRLPNTSLIAFGGCSAERILIGLNERGICASGGSACHSGSLEPSRVLLAMGIDRRLALAAVRFSLSRYSTDQDVDRLLDILPDVLARAGSPSKVMT